MIRPVAVLVALTAGILAASTVRRAEPVASTTSADSVAFVRGDATRDGRITALDAQAVLNQIAGRVLPSSYDAAPGGDANCDGALNASDALVILSAVVGRDVSQFCIMRPLVSRIVLTPDSTDLFTNDTIRVQVQLRDGAGSVLAARMLRWRSSNPAAAQVDSTGLVSTGVVGFAVLTAETDSVEASVRLHVRARTLALSTISVAPLMVTVLPGMTQTYSTVMTDVAGNIVSGQRAAWSSGNTNVATVNDSTGEVTAVAPGETVITASRESVTARTVVRVAAKQVNRVAAGAQHSCGLTPTGSAFCWGVNASGNLGDGTTTARYAPTAVVGSHVFVSVEAGAQTMYALKSDGSAYSWGRGNEGQLGLALTSRTAPGLVTSSLRFSQIAAGDVFAVGLTTNGTVYAWGQGTSGQLGPGVSSRPTPAPVVSGRTFRYVAAGQARACAIASTGETVCWGAGFTGIAEIPALRFENISISSYDGVIIGRQSDGTVYEWSPPAAPALAAGGKRFAFVVAGPGTRCGIEAGGAAYCWGPESYYAFGDFISTTPRAVWGGLPFAEIRHGYQHLTAVTTSGAFYSWGQNTYGQIGNGTQQGNSFRYAVPTAVGSPLGPQTISIVVTPGTARVGVGRTLQLDAGATDSDGARLSPVAPIWNSSNTAIARVDSVGRVTGVAAGIAIISAADAGVIGQATITVATAVPPMAVQLSHDTAFVPVGSRVPLQAVVVDSTGSPMVGSAVVWTSSAPGIATVSSAGIVSGVASGAAIITAAFEGLSATARAIVDAYPAQRVATAGDENTDNACALTPEGMAYCWGTGNSAATGSERIPSPVAGGHAFRSIVVSRDHACGLTPDGRAFCWGKNDNGQLGDGTTIDRTVPVAAGGELRFVQIAAANSLTWGLTAAGQVYRSSPYSGWVLLPGSVTFRRISANDTQHACGISTTGAAYCWGNNVYGQLGNGTTTNASSPVLVSGGRTYKEISTGSLRTLALTTTGLAYGWGYNSGGQIGDGTTTNRLVPVAVQGGRSYATLHAGASHAFAVLPTGVTYGWGYNGQGQLKGDTSTTASFLTPTLVASPLTFTSLAAGSRQTYAFTAGGGLLAWGWALLGDGTFGVLLSRKPVSVLTPFSADLPFVLSATALRMETGDTRPIDALHQVGGVFAPVTTNVTWESSAPAVASIDATGAITAVSPGSARITARNGLQQASADVVVTAPARVHSTILAPDSAFMVVKEKLRFSSTLLDSVGNVLSEVRWPVTWRSSDTAIIKVDSTGLATARVTGSAFVIASADQKTDSARVLVTSAAATLSLLPATTTLYVGRQIQMTPVALTETGDTLRGRPTSWGSFNPLRATVSETGVVTAVGAGSVQIRAEVDGLQAFASINVLTPVASVIVTPDSASIFVGRTQQLAASPRDGGGNALSRSVVWSSSSNAVATVSPTGLVTAMQPGDVEISATSEGVRGLAHIVVVPGQLSFGTEQFDVGRFASTEVPIILSFAPSKAVTVFLTSSDTLKARFEPQVLRFAAGQTQLNATVQGIGVGIVAIIARDSAGTYGADTSTVRVQIVSSLRFPAIQVSQRNQILNVGDRYEGEVRLSDPAPEGGLVFRLDGAGAVELSMDSVVVPAGQLAAPLAIRGIAATSGQVLIRAEAEAVTSTGFPIRVYPSVFRFGGAETGRYHIGVGQRELGGGYGLSLMAHVMTSQVGEITITVEDTTVATVVSPILWNEEVTTKPLQIYARKLGRTAVRAVSSTGWTSAVDTIVVTGAKLGVTTSYFEQIAFTTSAEGLVDVQLQDSLGRVHPAGEPTPYRIWTSNRAIMHAVDSVGTILPGTAAGETRLRIAPGGSTGVVWIYAGGPGFITDSTRLTVNMPKLDLRDGNQAATTIVLPTGFDIPGYGVVLPRSPAQPVVVHFLSTDTMVAKADSVIIPANTNSPVAPVAFRSRSAGTARVIAVAAGHLPDTLQVTSGLLQFWPASAEYEGLGTFQFGGRETLPYSVRTLVPRTITVTSLDTMIVKFPTTQFPIAAGEIFVFPGTQLEARAAGQAKVVLSAPGTRPDTALVTVRITVPSLSAGGAMLLPPFTRGDLVIQVPTTRTTPLTVTIANRVPSRVSIPTSVVIPAGTRTAVVEWTALALGGFADSVIFSAPGHNPVGVNVRIAPPVLNTGAQNRIWSYYTTEPRQESAVILSPFSTGAPAPRAARAVTLRVSSTDLSVLVPESTYVHIPVGGDVAKVGWRPIGPGDARLIFTDSVNFFKADTTDTFRFTAPPLTMTEPLGNGIMNLGMQQFRGAVGTVGGFLVRVPHPVTGAPLTVRLASSDPGVALVPATVTIAVGETLTSFNVTGGDNTGLVSIVATADGYLQSRYDVRVSRPRVQMSVGNPGSTGRPGETVAGSITLADSVGAAGHTVNDLVLTMRSSNTAVATVVSPTITLPAGTQSLSITNFVNLVGAGTAVISITDERTGFVRYIGASSTVTVVSP